MIKLMIKNMVCHRCTLVVQDIFKQLNLNPLSINLGEVTIEHPLTKEQMASLSKALNETGLALLDDNKLKLIEAIKQACLAYLDRRIFNENRTLSQHISLHIAKDYHHLTRLFSSVESISIEQYYLTLRIEKVKELIAYQQLAFSEIAYDIGFSSVAHLSAQFKKYTGLTLSQFRRDFANLPRISLDKVKTL